jgi:archaeal flagellin FlaB
MRDERKDQAQVGIGTMIVFIATVLVAAIAAGVLIDTSGKLQERSAKTGQDATEQVASNLNVESVIGRRNTTTADGLKYLYIYVSLAPGAKEVDLNELKIQVQNKTLLRTLSYVQEASPDAGEFSATAVRDADSSFSVAKPVMSQGDLVNITVHLDTANGINMELTVRDQVSLVFLPEVGNKIVYGFSTPPSYGTKRTIELR